MADYFRDILARLEKTATMARPVHPHPFTGERERPRLESRLNSPLFEQMTEPDLFLKPSAQGPMQVPPETGD